ncbi:MAG: asparagine synthase-related protein [Rhodomicrobium sp.]
MGSINGIFAYHYAANSIDRGELLRTRDHMHLRGPDGEGEWIGEAERVGFGYRCLAMDGESSPGLHATEKLAVTLDGRIYNSRELRRDLEGRGYKFEQASDAELLLHLYAAKGPAMLKDLRGMFALAIWDADRGQVFLARDPYGVKPLYYSDDGWTFRFASQVKSLLAGGALSRDLEPAGQVGFYLFGSVPEPYTTYRDIRALPAGTSLFVNRLGAGKPERYHSIAQVFRDAELDAFRNNRVYESRAYSLKLHEALFDSLAQHVSNGGAAGVFNMRGDGPGQLTELLRDASSREIQAVSVTFEDAPGEKTAPVREASLEGIQHVTKAVTASEFATDLPRILEVMDQPSVDGITMWFLSKTARELGIKAVISWDGAQELLGGHPSFRDIPNWVRLLSMPARIPFLGKAARTLGQPLPALLGVSPKAAGMLEFGGNYSGAYLLRRGLFMPWELHKILGRDIAAEGLRRLAPLRLIEEALEPVPLSGFARVATLESSLYLRNQLLRDADWASMAHSVEVRFPLADSVLLKKVAVLQASSPSRKRNRAKKDALVATLPSYPGAVLTGPGAGIPTPIGTWLSSLELPSLKHGMPIMPPSAAQPWTRHWACQLLV